MNGLSIAVAASVISYVSTTPHVSPGVIITFDTCGRRQTNGHEQCHRSERVVPTYAPAGVRSRGFVAAMFCPSGCGAATGAVVHSHSLTQ